MLYGGADVTRVRYGGADVTGVLYGGADVTGVLYGVILWPLYIDLCLKLVQSSLCRQPRSC